jgi:hypothetical protein
MPYLLAALIVVAVAVVLLIGFNEAGQSTNGTRAA